jgi:hypothetical protein
MLPKPLDGLWLQYALAVGLSILGGVVRMLISKDTHTALGIFLCGMTGLAGVEGLRALGKFYAASLKVEKPEPEPESDTDIFAGTRAAEKHHRD